MNRRSALRQRGAALLAMAAIIALGASWYLVTRLNAETGLAAATAKTRNAQVLNRAKMALIGYVVAQAGKGGAYPEPNPGSLPCPENLGDFDSTIGNDGKMGSGCASSVKVGRFPWRTIGTDMLVDAYGEPLWYVVSTNWAVPSGGNSVINSNTVGQLTVDGVANDAVALIIAPGPAITVPAATGCASWAQTRPATGTPDWRNYLECENATSPADSTFVTRGPSGSFNDQVIKVTVADLMPGIEAAIAKRIESEIVPALNTVFMPADWGFAGSDPIYPWAAPFANPGPGAGTSNYRGISPTLSGLLPFNRTQCTASASDPRCIPSLITWNGTPSSAYETYGYGYIQSQSCSWASADIWECVGIYHEDSWETWRPIRIEMWAGFNFVSRGLRALDTTKITVDARDDGTSTWLSQAVTQTAVMDNNGRVALTFGAVLPNIDSKGWNTIAEFRIRVDRAVIGDHPLLATTDPDPCPSYGCTAWFARNEWFRVAYYGVAQGFTNSPLPSAPSCGSTCLTVANVTPTGAKHALLILAGRSINGSARPSSTLADYLEFGNRTGNYERQTVTGAVTSVYVDTGAPNAYAVAAPVAVGRPFQFKALNANTGASTLSAAAISPASLVNANGSSLAASQLQAGAVGEVTYDGTQFTLYKRPFNDRIIVVK
jgi:hypothetical protein